MIVEIPNYNNMPKMFEENLQITDGSFSSDSDKKTVTAKKDSWKEYKNVNFLDNENAKVIFSYGTQVYRSLVNLEVQTLFRKDFIKRHKIESYFR